MKILLVHNYYQQRGGEDTVFEKERDLLRRAGHEVVEYCRSNHEVKQYSQISLASRTIWARDTQDECRQLIVREKPQIVHVHNTFVMISPSIYSACREFRVPVVQTLHNYRIFCPVATFFRNGHVCEECKEHTVLQSVRHKCYHDSLAATATVALMLAVHRRKQTWTRFVDRYIALSEFSRKKFCEARLPAEKLMVKPNFVYPDPGAGKGSRKYGLFVGRLSEEKGLNTLLEAWQSLPRSIPLRIAGDGPLREELQARTNRQGLTNVTFCGRLSSEEVIQMMQGARFVVIPSECYENCPMTILEAFACGCPVIAADIGGMQEIVENGRTGLHFRAQRPSILAEQVSWAWCHSREMDVMGRAARAEYEKKYTAEKNYQMLMRLYRSLLLKKQSSTDAPHAILDEDTRYRKPA